MRARSYASCARVCDSAPTPPDDRDERIGVPVTEKEGKTNNVAFHRQPRPERDTFFTTGSVLLCILQFLRSSFSFLPPPAPSPLFLSRSVSRPVFRSLPFYFRRTFLFQASVPEAKNPEFTMVLRAPSPPVWTRRRQCRGAELFVRTSIRSSGSLCLALTVSLDTIASVSGEER